jgi:hypothetical protein
MVVESLWPSGLPRSRAIRDAAMMVSAAEARNSNMFTPAAANIMIIIAGAMSNCSMLSCPPLTAVYVGRVEGTSGSRRPLNRIKKAARL